MKMEPVQKTMPPWTKPTVRQLSLDEVVQILDRENARCERTAGPAEIKPYTA